MIVRITPLKPGEQSAAVANLHRAIRALGYGVPAAEVNDQRAGDGTAALVAEFQARAGLAPRPGYLVDDATAAAMNRLLDDRGIPLADAARTCRVRGRVTAIDGTPVRDVVVVAFDQDLRRRQELGRSRTSSRGDYLVEYGTGEYGQAEAGGADVIVQVLAETGAVLAESAVVFRAPADLRIDLQLAADRSDSEFERITRSVKPLLEGQDVALNGLEENEEHRDITFLAAETGVSRDRLLLFAVAARLDGRGELPAPFWFAVGSASLTGAAVPPAKGWKSLADAADEAARQAVRASAAVVDAALGQAFDHGIIAAGLAGERKAWVERFAAFAALQKQGGAMGRLLGEAGVPAEAHAQVAQILAGSGPLEARLAALRERGLDPKQVEGVGRLISIHQATLGDTELALALHRQKAPPSGARDLAGLTATDWEGVLRESRIAPPAYVAGDTDEARIGNYARLLTARLERAHPTAAFAARLKKDKSAARKSGQHAKAIASFLDANPRFDLSATSVDAYLAKERGAVTGKDREGFVRQLKATQRVFKVAPSYEASATLLADGVHSAQQVYRMGRQEFVRRYRERPGFSENMAQQTYDRAVSTYAAAATIAGEIASEGDGGAVAALGGGTAGTSAAMGFLPDLATLFGRADFCECQHCRSIFSPAAYFTDVVHYLASRPTRTAGVSARDVLFGRRPDLAFIELTCENSNTPLPYIDLACEVLEDRIAPWKLFDLPLALAPSLVEGPVAPAVQAAFAGAAPSVTLSASASVSAKHPVLAAWVVRDGVVAYVVRQTAAALEVSRPRQTSGPAETLMAAPAFVNEAAYQALGTAVYPLALPFDLHGEAVGRYLGKIGVSRADVMEAFRGPNAPNNPADADIAGARLGLSPAERGLIAVPNLATQFTHWGEATDAAAIAAVGRVDRFLDRTGLEYDDLERLLSLRFINPAGTIAVVHVPPADPADLNLCDTSQKQIQVMDVALLDRIHRFLRLWRKLGWKMWELDLAIMNAGIGNGTLDAACLINLSAVPRLREAIKGAGVEQVCALFDDINTRAKTTSSGKDPEPSLYEQLFLNKRVNQPLDAAFAIATVTAANAAPAAGLPLLSAHLPPVVGALRLKAADITVLQGLRRPGNGPTYIDDRLRLRNLSFLYRHSLLMRAFRVKPAEWASLLYVLQVDPCASAAGALAFVKRLERMKQAGFGADELAYLLAADVTVKAAESEKTVTAALTGLRSGLQAIEASTPVDMPTDVDGRLAAIGAQLTQLGWSTATVTALAGLFQVEVRVASMPATFAFPAAVAAAMPIGFNGETRALSFHGLMTDAQQAQLLTDAAIDPAVRADANYQAAIAAIHDDPRVAMKFYWPEFRAPLPVLPGAIQFAQQLPAELAALVRYDTERRSLVFFGRMADPEKAALDALSADAAYRAAVQSLYDQPRTGVFPAGELWLAAGDDLGTALSKLVAYVARERRDALVTQRFSDALKASPAIVDLLVTRFGFFGGPPAHPVREDFTGAAFAASNAVVTPAAFPDQFAAYYWLHRVALLVQKLRLTYVELDWIIRTRPQTGVTDLGTLPLVFNAAGPAVAPADALLDLARWAQFAHAYWDPDLSLFGVVDRLIANPAYPAASFAADVEQITQWPKDEVERLAAAGVLAAAYQADYLRIAGWERLSRCLDLLQRLNASADDGVALAAAAMGAPESARLAQALRGKYDEEQWLDIHKAVQDGLRERKRDSLVAYLLTRPMPSDAPTGKWTEPSDLFAYCLIDVEMSACQPSSRLVQASAAAQFFVQRAFMGLEPDVRVNADEDEAWSQWAWMKNYRVWEANRRVFAYPENYAEVELRRDKSEFFADFENELLQREATRDTVETAFLHYLERLDGVAQLEVAGTYYQESTQTLHVFGRTPGSEPHAYFYRQFIGDRRWTPWKKVECDIKSDYLVPLVANERLHLVWPEFREQPDDQGSVDIPAQNTTNVSLAKPKKKMDVHLAITEFRNGKWLPKKVSKDPVEAGVQYEATFDTSPYMILPLDFTWLTNGPFMLAVYSTTSGAVHSFELAGCRGYPERYEPGVTLMPIVTTFERDELQFTRNVEQTSGDRLMPQNSLVLLQEILGLTPGQFRISFPHYLSFFDKLFFELFALYWAAAGPALFKDRYGWYMPLGTFYDWFYADKRRTFFVQHELLSREGTRLFYKDVVAMVTEVLSLVTQGRWAELYQAMVEYASEDFRFRLRFSPFYHPMVCRFTKTLYASGVEGLMARPTQFADLHFDFNGLYAPRPVVDPDYPQEAVDFDPGGSYSSYNWELFFFAPLLIMTRLSRNQKFADAMRWAHFIFDPTGGHDRDPVTGAPADAPQKYWITKPFYLHTEADYFAQRIESIANMLASNVGPGTPPPEVKALQDQVADWRANPFDPHLVAQFRNVAYQKLTVMKYLDNLVAWGDQLFRQDTLESVNEATQLYVLAAEILGARPRRVPPPGPILPESYCEIEPKLDAFSNAMVELENFVPALPPAPPTGGTPPPVPGTLYFCVPPNDKLLGYWDTVADRLYKIRHCLNIEGVFRVLPLFAPPIDPSALVRAVAGGADLSSALADLSAPLPHYRFTQVLQKANEFLADVKGLGSALLAALEKKDGEALSRLRQQHEIELLQAGRAIKQMQIDDATISIESLTKNRELITIRRDFYASREFVNPGETAALVLSSVSLGVHTAGTVADILGGVLSLIPNFQIGASGFGGSPHASAKTGGLSFSKASELAARALYQASTILDKSAGITTTLAGYQRRMEDWQFQQSLAVKELEQMDKQIASARKKLEVAQKELENHDLQAANAKSVADFFRDKYTNQELYEWMTTQISQTYFQSYQLAYDMAKRAERCFQYEIGAADGSFIQFGYWDSLKSGLQAGERLQLALRQLEHAYHDQNRREFECVKHVSLAVANPVALAQLKSRGSCLIDLPEELFDLDYPGHYFRRLKSVSLSIPCIAGPHTTVSCTLRLIKNMVRVSTAAGTQYEHNNDNGVLIDDERFRESQVRVKAMATSSAQNDSGLFELNFRDERYLPFEGAGAISTWQVELMADPALRQFDYDTIADVILHVRYTAREDAGQFRNDALAHLRTVVQTAGTPLRFRRLFDLRSEFSAEWYSFLHPEPGQPKILNIPIEARHFPALAQDRDIQVEKVWLILQTDAGAEMKAQLDPPLGAAAADQLTVPAPLTANDTYQVGSASDVGFLLPDGAAWPAWTLKLRATTAADFNAIQEGDVTECFLAVEFTLP